MALEKPYEDVPGTTIFDAEQARKGYKLNQFCMSLMKEENRENTSHRPFLATCVHTSPENKSTISANP